MKRCSAGARPELELVGSRKEMFVVEVCRWRGQVGSIIKASMRI